MGKRTSQCRPAACSGPRQALACRGRGRQLTGSSHSKSSRREGSSIAHLPASSRRPAAVRGRPPAAACGWQSPQAVGCRRQHRLAAAAAGFRLWGLASASGGRRQAAVGYRRRRFSAAVTAVAADCCQPDWQRSAVGSRFRVTQAGTQPGSGPLPRP